MGQNCLPFDLLMAESDREIRKTQYPKRQLRAPIASSQHENRSSF